MLSRFLYNKTDLQNILVHSLLFPIKNINKKYIDVNEPAYFWAYELYYSGFINELHILLWNIYYDFYAILYGNIGEYLEKNLYHNNLKNNPNLLGIIIHNFLVYRPNLDLYLLCKINKYTIDINSIKKIDFNTPIYNIICFINHCINNLNEKLDDLFKVVYEFININESFEYFKNKILNCDLIHIIGLKKIIIFLILYKTYEIKKSNIIITIFNNSACFQYSNLNKRIKKYNILSERPDINLDAKYYNLLNYVDYELNINHNNIKYYFDNWLFKVYFTPFWKYKINKYSGYIDYNNKVINWENDELFEKFSNKYDFEPDEQSIQTLHKGFINISKINYEYRLKDMIKNYYLLFPTFHIIDILS